AYGLVETDTQGNVTRFLEKPSADEITCDTINAGIYILEPDTFDRIPKDTPWSIERSFFPSLIERKETFMAYVYRGYWIDIGTPEKYMQVHRDIMDARFVHKTLPFVHGAETTLISPNARIEEGARVRRESQIEDHGVVEHAIVWANSRISQEAAVRRSILGRQAHIGRNATV